MHADTSGMSQKEKRAPTSQDRAFHILKPGATERLLSSAIKEDFIVPEEVKYIRQFVNELRASKNLGASRVFKIVSVLLNWRRILPPFATNTIDDLYYGISILKERDVNGHTIKQNTQRDYIMFLKRFYKWLIGNGYSSIPLGKITNIQAPGCDLMTKTAADLLDEMEVLAMINACQNNRDRALISMLYEGAFRIMELGTLTWSQVKFDEYGAVINVDLKTKRPRYIRLVSSVPHLATWMKSYPYKPEGNALVFISAKHHPLQYEAVNVQLKKIARRAGIKKRVSPHLFRHSRITHLHRQGCNEAVLKMMAWGHQGSRMMAVYSHLTGTDIDKEILRLHGIQPAATPGSNAMQAVRCGHCQEINEPGSTICGRCGLALSEKAERSMNQIIRGIERHPLYLMLMEEMKKKVAEMNTA